MYPEGFDPETNEWLEGYEKQREEWEKQYAEAHARWEAHKKQIDEAAKADAEARTEGEDGGGAAASSASSYSSAAPVAGGHPGHGRGTGRPAREAHRQLSCST